MYITYIKAENAYSICATVFFVLLDMFCGNWRLYLYVEQTGHNKLNHVGAFVV